MGPARVVVAALRLELAIPGARTLKDRRQVVQSLRDRLRARFEVACHDVTGHDLPTRAVLAVATCGADAAVLSSVIDRIRAFAEGAGEALVVGADSDVRPWLDGMEVGDG